MKKLLFTVVALGIGFATIPAHSGSPADIAVGEPYPGYDPYPGQYPYSGPDYDEEDDQDQISCWEGKQIVRHRHFRQVSPVRCSGAIYRYRAFKDGRPWLVRVDSYTARIVSARPLRVY